MGEGNEEAQPAVWSHALPHGRAGTSRCACATHTNVLLIPRWIPVITRMCSCDHKVYNGIRAGVNLGKLDVFSLIDRADSRAVPLRVRPFAVESSNLKSPGTRFSNSTKRVKRRALLEMHPSFSQSFPSSVSATLHVQLNRGRGRIIFSLK